MRWANSSDTLHWLARPFALSHFWFPRPVQLEGAGPGRHRIANSRLRAWLWILPVWFAFMFSFGILIEKRVFGELIPFVVCATTLIVEEVPVLRMRRAFRVRPSGE